MKNHALVIKDCGSNLAMVHKIDRDPSMYKSAGLWFLQTLATIERKCAKLKTVPCIHVEARMLTDGQIEALTRGNWYKELEEIVHAVESGKPRTL